MREQGVRLVIAPAALEVAIRDWVHESPLNRCNAGTDTCASWPVVDEIMAHIRPRIIRTLGPGEDSKR